SHTLVHVKNIIAIFIQNDVEAYVHRISILRENLENLISRLVQCQIPDPVTVVGAIVLQRDRIGKLVGGENLAVTVIDISPGTFECPCLRCAHIEVIHIVFTLDNLKLEEPVNQYACQPQKQKSQHCRSRN